MMDHPVVLVLTTTAAIVIASVVMIRAIVETITKPVRTKLSVKVASALLKDRLCLPTQLSDQIFGFIASHKKFDLPARPEDFTPELLTKVLRKKGTISNTTTVERVTMTSLKGGVHFRVAKAFLEYKGHANRRLPTSVVIKQVNGKNGISTFQKLGLFLKPYFPSISFGATIEELAYRLQGYLIELQFYRTHAREVRVPIPECYFSYYDYFNVRFVMIMEDLSPCENGEPDGFTPDQAKALLTNLASLHAQFWHSSGFKSEKKLWSYGGYWLGNKEMSHNKTIPSVFESTLSNFPVILEEFPEARRFSTALTKNLNLLTQAVHAREPKTLIHGDYKISNIFVDLKSSPYKPYSIDWQWMGRGNCATDVAYLLYTSLALTNPKWSFDTDKHAVSKDPKYSHYSAHEMDLLRTYYNALISHDNVTDYTFEEFEQQYAVNQVYFTVFCLREKWSTMSSTNMDFFYTNKIDGLHLRTKDHMIQMLKRSAVLLQHIDFEATKKLGYRSWKNKL